MKKIILASSSPRRKQLLEQIGLVFDIEPSNYEEDMTLDLSPVDLAKYLSHGKAKDIADKHIGEDVIIIGADTFIAFKDQVLGKPHTPEKAKQVLTMLNGTQHIVVTGLTVIDCKSGQEISTAVEAKVFFKQVTDEEIDAYIRTGEPLERAAGYAVQEKGSFLIEKTEGDFSGIVGLPIPTLVDILKSFNIKLFE
jgi:septum formation protein